MMGATTLETTISPRLTRRHAVAASGTLHPDIGTPRIGINTPAKPMAASAVTLKSSGFFISRRKTNGRPEPTVAL